MKRLLIATQLDYKYFSNTRTHHIVSGFEDRFENITVMYKVFTKGDGIRGFLKSCVDFGFRKWDEKGVSLIKVDHPFNTGSGLGLNILGIKNTYSKPPSVLKRMLSKVFSSMGFVFEMAVLPSFVLAYFLRDRSKYDVFMGEGIWALALGYILKKLGRVNLLVCDDYDYSPGFQPLSRFRRWYSAKIENYLIKKSDIVVSVGFYLAKLREEEAGRPVEVLTNGVNCRLFSSARKKVEHVPTIVYVGAVESWSGVDLMIKAVALVKKEIPHIRFLVIGHSAKLYESELEELISDYSLHENVHLKGAVPYDKLPGYFKEADIGIALYMPIELRKYAFSLKVVEYMAGGLPVIASKGTESGELVEKAGAGLSIEYALEPAAEAVMKLLKDKDFYEETLHNALKTSDDYDWQSITSRFYRLIEERYASHE